MNVLSWCEDITIHRMANCIHTMYSVCHMNDKNPSLIDDNVPVTRRPYIRRLDSENELSWQSVGGATVALLRRFARPIIIITLWTGPEICNREQSIGTNKGCQLTRHLGNVIPESREQLSLCIELTWWLECARTHESKASCNYYYYYYYINNVIGQFRLPRCMQ